MNKHVYVVAPRSVGSAKLYCFKSELKQGSLPPISEVFKALAIKSSPKRFCIRPIGEADEIADLDIGLDGDLLVRCIACGKIDQAQRFKAANQMEDLLSRVCPGAILPYGECLSCGGLAYVLDPHGQQWAA
jgi:hypothetical protein